VTVTATPAHAHGGDPTVVTAISAVTPPLPAGVVIQVRTTVSEQMIVANPTATWLVILDPDGAPFLRVSRRGAFGNLTNPYYHRTLNPPDVPPRIPQAASGGAHPPEWLRLGKEANWGWFEPRLHPFQPGTEPATTGVLATWRVGMRYGNEPVAVTGTLRRDPVLGGFIAGLDPPPAGLQVSVGQGPIPALLLVAPPQREVVVVGSDGQDFLRLDARGVFANTASPEFAQNPNFGARTGSAQGWVRVGAPGRILWQDPRLTYRADRPPEVVIRAERVADLGTWTIPLRVDGQPATLHGSLTWVPAGTRPVSAGGSGPPWSALGMVAALGAVLAGIALLARRRASLNRDGADTGESVA
jgi:hypothetical protein